MSEFLMIVPEEWTEIPDAANVVEAYPGGEAQVQDFIARNEFGSIDGVLEEFGLVPAGMTTELARLFSTGEDGPDRLRMWVKFIAIPA